MVSYQAIIHQDLSVGCAADGRLTAVKHDAHTVTQLTETWSEPSAEISKALNASPAIHTSQTIEHTSVNLPTAMRAPVEGPGSWALESAMDELRLPPGWIRSNSA